MRRKGQMFIVTTVFLAGLIFTVQGLLFQYSAMNMRGAFLSNEYEIIKSVRDSAVATLDGSPDCAEFGRNIRTLEGFIGSRSAISGYSVTVTHELSCYSTGAVREVKLTTHVVGDTVDSTNTFSLSR